MPSSLVSFFGHSITSSLLLVLMDRPESFRFTFPALDLSLPDLDEIRPDLGSTFHAYKDSVKEPLFSFFKSVLGHMNHLYLLFNAINS